MHSAPEGHRGVAGDGPTAAHHLVASRRAHVDLVASRASRALQLQGGVGRRLVAIVAAEAPQCLGRERQREHDETGDQVHEERGEHGLACGVLARCCHIA